MAANPVLVDSSFYITLSRRGFDPLRALAVTAMERDLAICGVVRCEVARGIRNPNIRAQFTRFWDVMVNVPTDNRIWTSAEELLWSLDREGKTIPLTDAIIACCALRIDATVLTYDQHFSFVPDLKTTDRLD